MAMRRSESHPLTGNQAFTSNCRGTYSEPTEGAFYMLKPAPHYFCSLLLLAGGGVTSEARFTISLSFSSAF